MALLGSKNIFVIFQVFMGKLLNDNFGLKVLCSYLQVFRLCHRNGLFVASL